MDLEELLEAVRLSINRLKRNPSDNVAAEARKLIKCLMDKRQFKPLGELAATFVKHVGPETKILLFQAQSLIEVREIPDALKLLQALAANLPRPSRKFVEAEGLLGRAWKQTFFDAKDKTSEQARDAFDKSLEHYKRAFDGRPEGSGSVWPGENLLALSVFAKREGISTTIDIEPRAFALKLLGELDATPLSKRDNWYHASRAEAYLGLGDLDAVEMHIGAYVRSDATYAFALAGTLRQFCDLWQLDQQGEKGHGIVQALRAALLADKKGGRLELSSDDVRQSLAAPRPFEDQLQKILGRDGLKTYDWLLKGLTMARAVGVISHVERGRQGTGFLVRAGDLIQSLGDELVVMTNAHVISDPPYSPAVALEEATITFEAVNKNIAYGFTEVLWQSCKERLDCTLLKLNQQPPGIEPLPFARDLPSVRATSRPRVYVIGYPGGRDLAFSLQTMSCWTTRRRRTGRPYPKHLPYPISGSHSAGKLRQTGIQLFALARGRATSRWRHGDAEAERKKRNLASERGDLDSIDCPGSKGFTAMVDESLGTRQKSPQLLEQQNPDRCHTPLAGVAAFSLFYTNPRIG